MSPKVTRAGIPILVVLAALVAFACGNDDPPSVSVRAEVIEPAAPVSVEATEVRQGDGGILFHGVRVEWQGEEAVRLDDARFTHHVESGNGHLVTAGRGCGAQWEDARREVVMPCTADLQLIDLEPGDAHEYPVQIYPSLGPLRLRAGPYVVEQEIGWRSPDDGSVGLQNGEGSFTVRLTYEVD